MPQTTAHAIGKILDRALRLYRSSFWKITLAVAVVLVPYKMLEILFPSLPIWGFLQNAILNPLAACAITVASIAMERGEPWSIGSAYRQGLARYLSAQGCNIMIGFAVALPILAVLFGHSALAFLPPIAAGIGYAVICITALCALLLFLGRYAVATPAIFAEHQRATASLRRSWALTEKHVWHSMGVAVGIAILNLLLINVLPSALSVLWFTMTWMPPEFSLHYALFSLISLPGAFIMLSFQPIAMVCLYYDLRIRSEGYDIELAAQQYGLASQDQADSAP